MQHHFNLNRHLKIRIDNPKNRKGMNELAEKAGVYLKKQQASEAALAREVMRIDEDIKQQLQVLAPEDRKTVAKALEKSRNARVAELAAKTEDARLDNLAELAEVHRISQKYAAHLGDPRIAASMYETGSPERAAYNAELANAGPAVLREYAMRAELMNDRHLASAVWRRSQDLPKHLRPVGDEFLQTMFRPLVAGVTEDAKVIDQRFTEAMWSERRIRNDVIKPVEKIAAGMKFGQVNLNDTNGVAEDGSIIFKPKSGTQKIAENLDSI